ncbi:hypothetical protein Tco_0627179 [Tanacetum coccineum]|uniref:Uncharacterized protein n=1 Tax=Tanacetum coccineum TaxID=301880 RepID=A0ABQ4WLS7_9ASTR
MHAYDRRNVFRMGKKRLSFLDLLGQMGSEKNPKAIEETEVFGFPCYSFELLVLKGNGNDLLTRVASFKFLVINTYSPSRDQSSRIQLILIECVDDGHTSFLRNWSINRINIGLGFRITRLNYEQHMLDVVRLLPLIPGGNRVPLSPRRQLLTSFGPEEGVTPLRVWLDILIMNDLSQVTQHCSKPLLTGRNLGLVLYLSEIKPRTVIEFTTSEETAWVEELVLQFKLQQLCFSDRRNHRLALDDL